MKIQKPRNENYCATVVALDNVYPLSGCDNVKGTAIFGNQVIVSATSNPGDRGLFFPTEVALSPTFLCQNNLFREPSLNVNPAAKGYFEANGRVRAMKFRGHKSEGFFIPLASLLFTGVNAETLADGTEFDFLNGKEICRKYIPEVVSQRAPAKKRSWWQRLLHPHKRKPKIEDRLVPGQFRFHENTAQLGRNAHRIQPTDVISITEKIHGTSAVFAHVLCKRQLSRWERFKKALRLPVMETEYNYVWSSRAVVKGIGEPTGKRGYYGGDDIWTDVFQEIKPFIPAGWTFYGEITGYTKSGKPIQKGYHYGSKPGEHKLWVYRITKTDASGNVLELPFGEIKEYLDAILDEGTVPQIYFSGRAALCFTDLAVAEDTFGESFFKKLEKRFLKNAPCPLNNNEVPAEGIVLRVENRDTYEAYKLKNFAFKERETKAADAGEVDLETLEAEQEQQCQPEQ